MIVLVLAYFVETEDNPHLATPFNILPVELARRYFALELAAMLPSSSTDLSFGWTRPRHLLGLTPLINFYSNRDIGSLLENPEIKKPPKFFLAWKNFSIELIHQSSTKTGPSLVLTTSNHIAKRFHSNSRIYPILYADDEPREKVYRRCYNQLVRMFNAMSAKTYNYRPCSIKLKEGYCLQKTFLPETQTTASLLCLANEIVLAQARGKPPMVLGKEDYPPPDNETCYLLNKQMAEQILAERLVDIMLGATANEIEMFLKGVPSLLEKSVGNFLKRFPSMSREMKKESYLFLIEIALDTLKEVFAHSEMTLFVPTVNPSCREHLIYELEKDLEAKHKKELRYVVDRVLRGGREIVLDMSKLDKRIVEIARELANTRISENAFATSLVGLFASRRLSPVLKSVTAPAFLFEELEALRQYINLGYLSESRKPSWCMTVGERFDAIQAKLGECIPRLYVDAIQATRPSYITVVSDLPFEIAQCGSGMAICQEFPTTRIPMTPLGSLLHHYNNVSQRLFVGKRMQSLENVLIVNSIHEEDILYWEFELFESTCRKVGLDFNVKTVLSSDDFVETLNSTNPDILAYYGHGSYNVETDEGALVFRDDRLSHKSFNKLLNIPPIVFLVGCETASCSAFMGGLPAHLLERGAFAILGTLFPISADHAGAFLGRTLAFANDLVHRGKSTTFSNLIFQARKLGWLLDNLDALEKNGTISLPEKAEIMKEISDDLAERSLKKGKDLLIAEAIPVFSEYLQSYGMLETWKQIRPTVIPNSLFFSLLGNAHDVFIGG